MEDRKFWNFSVIMYDFWHMLEYNSYKFIANSIVDGLNGNEKVLEVACGTGILTEEITKRCSSLDYTAIDYAQNMIDICNKKSIPATFLNVDATNMPFEENSFDTIIIANALHIMPNSDKVLSEISRCLKPTGTLYAPNFLTPTTIKEKIVLNIIRKFGYKVYNEFTIESLTEFLLANGFLVNKREIYKCIRTILFTYCTKKEGPILVRN